MTKSLGGLEAIFDFASCSTRQTVLILETKAAMGAIAARHCAGHCKLTSLPVGHLFTARSFSRRQLLGLASGSRRKRFNLRILIHFPNLVSDPSLGTLHAPTRRSLLMGSTLHLHVPHNCLQTPRDTALGCTAANPFVANSPDHKADGGVYPDKNATTGLLLARDATGLPSFATALTAIGGQRSHDHT